jgi:23S rRNA pseudouridine2605 synthase
LIIVTNDGELTERLTHPRYGVPKTYLVQVAGKATGEIVSKLLGGVHLAEGVARAARAFIRRRHKNSTQIEMVLTEGRNREIRRMLAQVGHKVQRLTRTAVGPVRLGKLKPGQFRPLDGWEIRALKEIAFRPGRSFERRAGKDPRKGHAKFPKRRDQARDDVPREAQREGKPTGDRRRGKPREFARFADKRTWSRREGGPPPPKKQRPPKKLHPLPFLQQGVVVDDQPPTDERPPEKKSLRRKPLRRLQARRR